MLALDGQPGRIPRNQPERNPLWIAFVAMGARTDDQRVRGSAVEDLNFFARDPPALAVGLGAGSDPGQLEAALWLLVGERQEPVPRDHRG